MSRAALSSSCGRHHHRAARAVIAAGQRGTARCTGAALCRLRRSAVDHVHRRHLDGGSLAAASREWTISLNVRGCHICHESDHHDGAAYKNRATPHTCPLLLAEPPTVLRPVYAFSITLWISNYNSLRPSWQIESELSAAAGPRSPRSQELASGGPRLPRSPTLNAAIRSGQSALPQPITSLGEGRGPVRRRILVL
jgi:hypothetical protein